MIHWHWHPIIGRDGGITRWNDGMMERWDDGTMTPTFPRRPSAHPLVRFVLFVRFVLIRVLRVFRPSNCLSVCPIICSFICLSVCLFVCQFVCLLFCYFVIPRPFVWLIVPLLSFVLDLILILTLFLFPCSASPLLVRLPFRLVLFSDLGVNIDTGTDTDTNTDIDTDTCTSTDAGYLNGRF